MRDLAYVVLLLFPSIWLPVIHVQGYERTENTGASRGPKASLHTSKIGQGPITGTANQRPEADNNRLQIRGPHGKNEDLLRKRPLSTRPGPASYPSEGDGIQTEKPDSDRNTEEARRTNERRKRRCGTNEEFKECVSSKCSEWKCSYLWAGWPTRCTRDCRRGCFCKHGYFRTRSNHCKLGYHCFYESRLHENNRAE
uniref:TIL domain containing protein n=1 Tax=Rhipicephalus zambeziensis TaxID=60191 RepID=A0A224YRG8_9ACAR